MATSDLSTIVSVLESLSIEERELVMSMLKPEAAVRQPSYEDVSAEAHKVAEQVYSDIFELGSIEQQRKRLGPLLRAPLPLSSVDAGPDMLATFATELLPFEGSFESFSQLLNGEGAGREQTHSVLAVTQASGSGKTKLAYAEGAASSLVVFIRVVKQSGSFTPAWRTYLDFANALAKARTNLTDEGKLRASCSALAALRLLVASYVEWVSLILKAVNERLSSDDAARDDALRLAALRCLRNGRGDAAVGRLFSARLAQFLRDTEETTAEGGSPVRVRSLDDDLIKDHVAAIDSALRAQLWAHARVVVWYDEAQQLMSKTPLIFLRLSDYSAGKIDGEPQDVLYGLTALMSSLMDEPTHWRQVVCGPFLELSERVRLPEYSCVHGRVRTLHHVSVITELDMVSSISRHFEVGHVSEAALGNLRRLRGRPKWFFDTFWLTLWTRIGTAWTCPSAAPPPPLTGEALMSHIEAAAADAAADCESIVQAIVAQAWKDTEEVSPRRSMSILCRELYVAVKLNGGRVKLGPGVASNAIRFGLLALQPATDRKGGESVQLGRGEPCLADALERFGDACVTLAACADDDPVFQLLESAVSQGSVAGFNLTTSVKGPVLELLFVWHVLRTRIRMGDGATVAHALGPYAYERSWPDSLRERLHGLRLATTRACAPSGGGLCREFEMVAHDVSTVLFGIDQNAGADVLFAARDATTGACTLISVQAKASASLADCLRSASPAWQFTTEPQRIALISGKWSDAVPARSASRMAFEALATTEPLSSMLAGAVRVALCVNSFTPRTASSCRKVNEHPALQQSPVLLCSVRDAVARDNIRTPSRLANTLVESCKEEDGSSPFVSHPTAPVSATFWMPHPVATVAAAFANRQAVQALPGVELQLL